MASQRLVAKRDVLVVLLSTGLVLSAITSGLPRVLADRSPTNSGGGAANGRSLSDLDYESYPMRTAAEAAVVEWGHSAIISALDAAVASFGPQTSRGAYFEVEASPVLADPVDGDVERLLEDGSAVDPATFKLKNSDQVEGNMVVMTNAAGMTGVEMARIAKNSGAAALMVVNTDKDHPDFIYSMEPEDDEEEEYAKTVDIPVVMVSRTSGNVLTTATVVEGMTEEEMKNLPNHGMPERVRLYAGGDRPFFEDVTAATALPTVYLIHNMLTDAECTDLIASAGGKFKELDDTKTSILEHITASSDGKVKAVGIDRAVLWKGQLHSHAGKQIEERIDQVTGYPAEHFSDWHVDRFRSGSFFAPHFDVLPTQIPIASISVFLNDVPEESGGDIVYPNVSDGTPVKIHPTRGLAVVHHNTDDQYQFDAATLHAELELTGGDDAVKYVARKYIYALPQSPARRVVLPIAAMMAGGALPDIVLQLHDVVVDKFGLEKGPLYFDKIMTMFPVVLLLLLASAVTSAVKGKVSASGSSSSDGKNSSSGAKKKPSVKKPVRGTRSGNKTKGSKKD